MSRPPGKTTATTPNEGDSEKGEGGGAVDALKPVDAVSTAIREMFAG